MMRELLQFFLLNFSQKKENFENDFIGFELPQERAVDIDNIEN